MAAGHDPAAVDSAGHDAWEQARAMGLHAGNVAAFSKQHIQAIRGRRFAMADEPVAEAARGGFTDHERAGTTGSDKPKH